MKIKIETILPEDGDSDQAINYIKSKLPQFIVTYMDVSIVEIEATCKQSNGDIDIVRHKEVLLAGNI